jgi:hypothetical protein
MTTNAMRSLLPTLLLLASGAAPAATTGTSFFHHDWELHCDNTGTCRVAGYNADDSEMPVSVLLTRDAGPGTAVTGQLTIGTYDDEPFPDGAPELTMWVAGRDLGKVALRDLTGPLSRAQVDALLAMLTGDDNVAWLAADGRRWALSTHGSSAVLLKMDDVQGRVGTPGALVRRGTRAEAAVPAARPAPVVRAAAIAPARPGDAAMVNASEGLAGALLATVVDDEECPDLTHPEGEPQPLDVVRLGEHKLLVSTRCWLAAYNAGSGYWVTDDAPPWNPVLVTTAGTGLEDSAIVAQHKSRGLGDCWGNDEWTWDGERFVHTQSATTGMCKLVTPGGTWFMPTIVTDVRSAPAK